MPGLSESRRRGTQPSLPSFVVAAVLHVVEYACPDAVTIDHPASGFSLGLLDVLNAASRQLHGAQAAELPQDAQLASLAVTYDGLVISKACNVA
jgi:hypothetical protein